MLKKKFYIEKMERDPTFVRDSSFLRMINEKNNKSKKEKLKGTLYQKVDHYTNLL